MTDSFFRGRRSRSSEKIRALVCETVVHSSDFISPIFVMDGTRKKEPVDSMPGVDRLTVDLLGHEVEAIRKAGVPALLIFGIPDEKDAKGSSSWKENGVVQRAIKEIKRLDPGMTVITDVCLCEYTDHGHCGHLNAEGVDNDVSLGALSKMALSHAQAGADVVAPSDMMDGRVKAIRSTLDESGFLSLPILSYAAKYASGFYGPFREAAQSAPKSGDRKSYQMDFPNVRQAMREIEADIAEGADLVMVKPALAYLDVIHEARSRFDVPIVAYNVSGEYSMVKAAAAKGWVDEKRIVTEVLTGIKRAGADRIITYHAKDFAKWI
jgi:porphobilinogen synthase